MQNLQELYWKAIAGQIASLEDAYEALAQGEAAAEETIRRIAHSLRGSGGTYGYPQVTVAAGAAVDAPTERLVDEVANLLSVLHELDPAKVARTRILVIDDDPAITELLKYELSTVDREVLMANSATEAEEILRQTDCALIVLDLVLPDLDGRNLLKRLRAHPSTARVPVFVLSGTISSQTRAECLALGADEYIEKPFDPSLLQSRVSEKLRGSSSAAGELARDELTQLPSRAAFAEVFQRKLTHALQHNEPLTLALLDPDHFQSINAKYGRDVGDRALLQLTTIITRCLRKSDQITRWSDAQIVVLLPNTKVMDGVLALEKVRAALRKTPLRTDRGEQVQLTISAGVTDITEAENAEEAVICAGRFLLQAKQEGRDRVCSPVSEEAGTKPMRILLAEDDKLIANIVKHRLQREGFQVIHHENGADAYEAAQDVDLDMAILDVKMPGMDGFELLVLLRKMSSFQRKPIVMLTSMGSERDIVRGFDLGADDYILKPFSPIEVLARIHRLLRKYSRVDGHTVDETGPVPAATVEDEPSPVPAGEDGEGPNPVLVTPESGD
jgi:two-component system cell cycle response regulator